MSALAEARPSGPGPGAQMAALIFAVLLLDDETRIAETNPAAEDLLCRSAKRLVGLPVSQALDIADERVRERLAAPDEALVARDVRLRIEGAEKRVNLTLSPVPNHPGWRVLTLSDAGRDDAALEDGADAGVIGAPAILAHEIKNPLAAIRGAGQLAGRKLTDADRGLARLIVSEVDRIARLIDRMQALGRTRAEPVAPCNLHEAIRSAIATVRAAGNTPVEIAEEFDPSLPPVLASRDALEQVIINLVSNACDAATAGAEGTPLVTVRTRFVSGLAFSAVRLGRSVRLPIEITVSDNGAGIGEALREHVFEPFVTSKKDGQGLGLALVRKLVRDMSGRIAHERDARAGLTHFRIHLPVASSEAKA